MHETDELTFRNKFRLARSIFAATLIFRDFLHRPDSHPGKKLRDKYLREVNEATYYGELRRSELDINNMF